MTTPFISATDSLASLYLDSPTSAKKEALILFFEATYPRTVEAISVAIALILGIVEHDNHTIFARKL